MTTDEACDSLLIRPFSSLEEYEACTQFQEEIWGEGFNERVSGAILMIANRIGGLAAGAFGPEGELRGFVFGLTGVQEGVLVHWSDMLAVRSHLRDEGLGTRLKHYQREVLLGRGVARMYWTFDPLQSRNAYVNFRKLGIVSREYVRDMYGETGSPLHGGLGTDRLVAVWEMDSPRVTGRLAGVDLPPGPVEWKEYPWALLGDIGGEYPVPETPDLTLDTEGVLVSIPRNMGRVMAEEPALALRWRAATRETLQAYLERGYEVREFFPERRLSHYLLKRTGSSRQATGGGSKGGEG